MAATSHDFWLANLSAPVWKSLHMNVYLAYVLLLLHVVLGVLQSETQPLFAALLAVGAVLVLGLHLYTGLREVRADRESGSPATEGWLSLCPVDEIPENRARIFPVAGERVAVFRYDGKVSVVSNVCRTSVSTRTDRSARVASSTVASRVRGTVTSTNRIRVGARHPSPSASPPSR